METPEEIKRHLRYGDLNRVAELAGLKYDNARKALERVNSKHHATVVKKANLVINSNRLLGL